ncbi:MAG: hypothetical protein WBL50_09875 [Candidatus Acidiferrum sp.]
MDIREAVEQRKKQIERLQREIQTLEAAEELIKGKPIEKPKSQPDMANAILEEIGKPMHVTQISTQIKTKFGQNVKPNNLGVMLFRYAKRGSRFYKVEGKPNTYGLVKWQQISERLDHVKMSASLLEAAKN